jgi:GDPmannose 4,6-dehydratase
MHLILQAYAPDDFVLATGETRSVSEFVELAFAEVDRAIEWRGTGTEEIGVDSKSRKILVRIDPTYFRPTEVDELIGDASKARQKLGWKPKTTLAQIGEGNGRRRSRHRQTGSRQWQTVCLS